jgi:hypothetical protein
MSGMTFSPIALFEAWERELDPVPDEIKEKIDRIKVAYAGQRFSVDVGKQPADIDELDKQCFREWSRQNPVHGVLWLKLRAT